MLTQKIKKQTLDNRQAVLLRGGSLVPPAKGCKFEDRKRKEKKKEEKRKKRKHLERKREKKEDKSIRKQQRISKGGKRNSQAVMLPYRITNSPRKEEVHKCDRVRSEKMENANCP